LSLPSQVSIYEPQHRRSPRRNYFHANISRALSPCSSSIRAAHEDCHAKGPVNRGGGRYKDCDRRGERRAFSSYFLISCSPLPPPPSNDPQNDTDPLLPHYSASSCPLPSLRIHHHFVFLPGPSSVVPNRPWPPPSVKDTLGRRRYRGINRLRRHHLP